jgi:hypothetical protein
MTPRRSAWPSLEHLWGIATVTLLALRVQLTPIAPNDFWWHIATGRLIVQFGGVPATDHFSYIAYGQPYFNQPWLAQVLMYASYTLGGAALLELLQAILIGASFGLLYLVCRSEGANARIASIATLTGALVAMDNWQIRPQTYAVPLFIGTLALLLRWRRGKQSPLWLLPLLMIVWVNTHGTFVLLPVLCGCAWLGVAAAQVWADRQTTGRIGFRHLLTPRLRSLAGWSLVALIATTINPRGIGIWSYVGGLVSNRAVSQLVTEWTSPFNDLGSPMTIVFLIVLVLLTALCIWRWRALTFGDILLLLPFTVLALQSVRNILWFGIVAAPVAARLLTTSTPTPRRKPVEIVLVNRLIAGLLALLLIATLPWWKETLGLPPTLGDLLSGQTPVAATQHLRSLPQRPQRLFHENGFGSYLIWAAPEQQVFVDPRIELYAYDQWRDYITLGQGRELDALTRKYGFDGWLVNPEVQADLVTSLDRNPRWQRVFATDEAIYYGPRATADRSP